MTVGDAIRNSNSWHWLALAAVGAAAVSVFMPACGWRDALAYCRTELAAKERRSLDALAEAKRLSAIDGADIRRKADSVRRETAKAKADFAAYGMEPLPTGDKAVFAAQSRVGEALNGRRLRVLSTEAKVAEKSAGAAAPQPAGNASPAKSADKRMTAAEYRQAVERQAAQVKDPRLREMILADGRRQAARMESAEKSRPTERGTSAAPAAPVVQAKKPAAAPFPVETLDYRVAGDFRDIFMFFVAETHKMPNYGFRDISVSRGGSGMDLSFVLEVGHE